VGAFEGIGLVFLGAFVKWVSEMTADRRRKAEETDKTLAAEESKLRDKVADLDKTNSMAIATLTAGIQHIVDGLEGIRSDMREHREVVFRRLDRNEGEIQDVKDMVSQSNFQLQAIQLRLGGGEGQ
jgi:hypothetical protein